MVSSYRFPMAPGWTGCATCSPRARRPSPSTARATRCANQKSSTPKRRPRCCRTDADGSSPVSASATTSGSNAPTTASCRPRDDREPMDTQRFRMLTAAKPPFASVYLDDSRDSAEAERDVDARWRELRGKLEEGCRDESIIAEVAHAVLHSEPAVGRRGRGVIATGDGLLVNEH